MKRFYEFKTRFASTDDKYLTYSEELKAIINPSNDNDFEDGTIFLDLNTVIGFNEGTYPDSTTVRLNEGNMITLLIPINKFKRILEAESIAILNIENY